MLGKIYKLTRATTLDGEPKDSPTVSHMFRANGFFYTNVEVGRPFMFMYLDDTDQTAVSSDVTDFTEDGNEVSIITTNTKYYFREVPR